MLGHKNTSDRQGRSWCQCSCQEERFDLGHGQDGEGEEGEKCPLVPVNQGSKCCEEGAAHGKVLKLLGRF